MMMHAGLFDGKPRTRELIWILLAQRAARAIGGLMLHSNEFTMEEAVQFASEWTPRGWLPEDGNTVWGGTVSLFAAARLRHQLCHWKDRD